MGVDVKIMAEQMDKINENLYQANIDLVDKNKKLENEIEKLKQRLEIEIDISDGMLKAIDKAIEYIETIVKNTPSSTRKDYANMILIDYKKVLEILNKGSE